MKGSYDDEESIQVNSKRIYNNRPSTPHIDLLAIRDIKKHESEHLVRNFSAFMKQIVDTQNENFLNGDIRVVQYILSKYLNIEYSNVPAIKKLSIKINSEFGLLNQFGEHLPCLEVLKLNNSVINSISEIGTTFRNLKILQLNNCGLRDLSGIICFQNLEIFEATSNQISDLIDLEMCSSLMKLNLRNNLIADEENLHFLSNLTELKWLNLAHNPITSLSHYKELVTEILSHVEYVDKDEDIIADNQENISDFNQKVDRSNSTTASSPDLLKIKKGFKVEDFFKETKDDFKSMLQDNTKDTVDVESSLDDTISTFRGKVLKPVIIKKEENSDIKTFREILVDDDIPKVKKSNKLKVNGYLGKIKKSDQATKIFADVKSDEINFTNKMKNQHIV